MFCCTIVSEPSSHSRPWKTKRLLGSYQKVCASFLYDQCKSQAQLRTSAYNLLACTGMNANKILWCSFFNTGFKDPSALLKHELAYCLGQTKNPSALPVLESVLRDKNEDPMVRHEVYLFEFIRKVLFTSEPHSHSLSYHYTCPIRNGWQAAEAMGAISQTASIPILKEYLTDSERSVRETCEIALAKIEWDNSFEGKTYLEKKLEEETPYVHITSIPFWYWLFSWIGEQMGWITISQNIHLHRPRARHIWPSRTIAKQNQTRRYFARRYRKAQREIP